MALLSSYDDTPAVIMTCIICSHIYSSYHDTLSITGLPRLGTPGWVTCGVEGRAKEGCVGTYMHGTIRCCRLDVLLTIFLSDERVQRPFAGKMASCGACAL